MYESITLPINPIPVKLVKHIKYTHKGIELLLEKVSFNKAIRITGRANISDKKYCLQKLKLDINLESYEDTTVY